MAKVESAFAGVGVGVLIGLLTGLSGSPVVAAVIGALLGMLALFLGFGSADTADTSPSDDERSRRQIATAAFAFAMAVGALVGIYMRVNNVMAPSPASRVAAWESAKFSPEKAQLLAVFETTGLVPEGTAVDEKRAAQGSVILYAGNREACDQLIPSELPDTASWQLVTAQVGGEWAQLSRIIRGLPARDQMNILNTARGLACGK
jgi:hypothetical protein